MGQGELEMNASLTLEEKERKKKMSKLILASSFCCRPLGEGNLVRLAARPMAVGH